MHRLFPDCEIGAEPPFGKLYELPVFVATPITKDDTITFNAGTHDEAIRMAVDDFERMTDPSVIDCSVKGVDMRGGVVGGRKKAGESLL